jgi:hypothetical protein
MRRPQNRPYSSSMCNDGGYGVNFRQVTDITGR